MCGWHHQILDTCRWTNRVGFPRFHALKRTVQRLLEEPSMQIGDKLIVRKEGSSLVGKIVTVVDPNWNGMVKVDFGGSVKSYAPSDLEPVPVLREDVATNAHQPPLLVTRALARRARDVQADLR